MELELSPLQAKNALIHIMKGGRVPMLESSPAIGKSSIIRQIAEEYNLKTIDVRLSQYERVDLNGYPHINDKGRTRFAPTEEFPLEGDEIPDKYDGWILFLDEFNSASIKVQTAAYKLILDRMVGQAKLHNDLHIICAGNKLSDNAIVNKLSTAMTSRLCHLKMKEHVDDWLKWAFEADIDQRIVSFIRIHNDMMYKFNPKKIDETYPSPRTWEMLSDVIEDWDEMDYVQYVVMCGIIGKGTATTFLAYVENQYKIPSIAQMIDDPEGVEFDEEPSIYLALLTSISRGIDESNSTALMTVLGRLPMEFQTVAMKEIYRFKPELKKTDNIKKWIKDNSSKLFD